MKEILIINGSGGVGKDTFVGCLKELTTVFHTSIVNPVKDIAKQLGWDGAKSEKDRKFLSDLKVLIDDYNDGNYKAMSEVMKAFKSDSIKGEILCIDMREKHQIEKAKKEFGAKAVLVTRDSVPHITSNIADAGVFDVNYDYHIENNGSIEELLEKAKRFLQVLQVETYEKVIYISHPFQGKQENLDSIQAIILDLLKQYPTYLFISPVHAFGFEYKELDYQRGLNECLWLMLKADEVWVYGDYENSTGCQREIELCKVLNIPVIKGVLND